MDDFLVFDCLQIAEAGQPFLPVFVEPRVDDAHGPADELFVPISQEKAGLAIAEGLVFLGVEVLPFVHVDRRNPIALVFMELFRKINKRLQVPACLDLADIDGHGSDLHGHEDIGVLDVLIQVRLHDGGAVLVLEFQPDPL